MSAEPTKECRGCRRVRPLSAFTRQAATRGGRTTRCRACHAVAREAEKRRQEQDADRADALAESWAAA